MRAQIETDTNTARALLEWYDKHARDLPWRVPPGARGNGRSPDPYRIWMSEVMLQQTTVAAVKDYFARFTERWPTVEDLARAPVEDVMSAWAGLGYYARARNLHACAKVVAFERNGAFPRTMAGLKELPGIGDYTSAAIAAIAFAEPAAVVDGNVERVVSRLHAIETPLPRSRPAIRAHVAAMTPGERPGDFAQGMMDLGATICTPKKPACVICPVSNPCQARRRGEQGRFPVKLPKAVKPKRRGAAFVAFRANDGAVWLRRRAQTGMLGGMAEPPGTDWAARRDGATGAEAAPFPATWRPVGEIAHGFTHFDLTLDVWRAELTDTPEADGWWSPPDVLAREALPTLMKKAVALAAAAAPEGKTV